jgi:NAD(P)H dehydrogenase (quinone)
MRKPKILVTAAAGKTGAATSLELLRRGFPVRAMVRRQDERSRRLGDAGAEIAVGSMEDWVDLEASLKGVDRAYFCPPLEPGTLRRAALFAAAAQEAKLEFVAVLSQWLADPLHPAIHAREKWLSGKIMEWMPGVATVTVNPGFFADNYMAALETAAQLGLMALPLGEGLNAPPSNEDIARVVAGTLTDPASHIGKTYRPTGPRLLSPDDIAAIMAKVLGRPVKYQNAPMTLFLKASTALRLPDFVVEELSWFLLDYQRNAFGLGAPTAAVLEVGGAAPEDFETILRRYVAASPVVRRSVGARGRALAKLMKALLAKAPDPAAIAERLQLPPLAHARLASESRNWLGTHAPSLPAAAADTAESRAALAKSKTPAGV